MLTRVVAAALVAATLLIAPVAAAPAASKKPYLKVESIALNRWVMHRGAKVEANDETNGCYTIAGPEGVPQQLVLYGNVTARNIPKSAPLTVTWTAPWHQPGQPLADEAVFRSTWGKGLAKVRGGKDAFERYTMAPVPTSSWLIDGAYGMKVSVTVGGKRLTSAVSASVNCL